MHAENNDFGQSLAKSVGLDKNNFPDVVLWEFGETEDDDKVFRLSQQTDGGSITGEAIDSFVSKWQDGGLAAEKDPVVAVTTETFDGIVIDNDHDVFVEFYAPWCGHCKQLAPTYKQLAQHYAEDPGISIVKMDATQHKHSSVDIKSFPTLKFYRKGEKSEPMDTDKMKRDKQSMVEFIEKHRTGSKKGGGSSKKNEKTQAASTQKGAPSVDLSMGVWAFDDLADQSSRGKLLSADMVASKVGYTLVSVGGTGILISPSGKKPVAVRQFASAAEAKKHYKSAKGGSDEAAPSGAFACPGDADMETCQSWCDGISSDEMKLTGTLGGKACKDVPADAKPAELPQCMCYDADFTEVYGMCRSTCKSSSGKKTTKTEL